MQYPGPVSASNTRPVGSAVAEGSVADPTADQSVPVGDSAGMSLPPRHYAAVLITGLVVLALDQLTKWWALVNLDVPKEVIGSLRLSLHFNSGAAFSMGSGGSLGPFIAILAVIVVVVLVFAGDSTRSRIGAISVGLIAGGAFGNLIDRAFREGGSGFLGGHVVDFIDVGWWPVFNVADAGICVGAVALVIFGLRAPASSAA